MGIGLCQYGFYAAWADMFIVSWAGDIEYNNGVNNKNVSVRPVINLRSDVQITGSGTTDDPFRLVS